MSQYESSYEALVFYSRHWELLLWLEDHWYEDDAGKVMEAAKQLQLPADALDKLGSLVKDGSEFHRHFDEIVSNAGTQARRLVGTAVTEMQAALRNIGCQCGELKRATARSYWKNEFSLRPKYQRSDGLLSIGATVDYVVSEQSAREPRLVGWMWLKSGRRGLAIARNKPSLATVTESATGLDKGIEQDWPNTLVLSSAPILPNATESYELDVRELIDVCLAPIRRLTHEHVVELYKVAGS